MTNPTYERTVKLAGALAGALAAHVERLNEGRREQLTHDLVTFIEAWEPPEDEEEALLQARLEAGGDVAAALTKLYRACDGDEVQVGEIMREIMHEIHKVARLNADG